MRLLLLTLFLLIHFQSSALPAPDFQLQDIKLSDYKGKVVYLDFWASWCKPCRKSFPWMNEMTRKYESEGLVVLAVNLDKDGKLAQKFLTKYPAQFKIAFDPQGSLASQYQIPGMPTSYLINRQGELVVAHKGFHVDKSASYEQEIVTLLNQ
ncbi:TlpA disulfide reductase family protein [Aliiglaciecola sp. 2_MG-2023]|uniref:TlpA disulfide reductase family protein n=1 Tax=Alteromonadaceae TaxID=72275 RepID=UPI0026E2B142|nr:MULTISPECIES: TlpA disulfide reductase family protein [unclassified Aliiglaciecola]MDO6711147.1 TlpA disulfide reductase family protein [Aliiglaciecola sp. 2_MG-2023]MDO6752061.1 TlpA disulfide reductase family protein [Aliiglaciecola sp. 1_MG-2023]